MSVVRGYNFQPAEFVTANSLHALVDSASITDLTPDEFSGEVHGLSTSTPASIRDGDVLFLHETSVSLVRPINGTPWYNPTYLVHYNGHWISLFGADHMETGRFYNEVGSALTWGQHCFMAGQAGSGAVTLTLAIDSSSGSPKAQTVGGLHFSSVADGSPAKIRMIGFGLFNGSSRTAGTAWLDALYHGDASSNWVRSTASNSALNAMRLNSTADNDSDTARLQPCYHLGALNFRA